MWQTPLLLPILLAQAGIGGAGTALVLAPFFDLPGEVATASRWMLLAGVLLAGFLIATELTSKGTVHVELAQGAMTRGPYRGRFWASIGFGMVTASVLAAIAIGGDSEGAALVAGVAAIAGVALYEDAFVRAGQSVPLS